jgi:hypothetical protein
MKRFILLFPIALLLLVGIGTASAQRFDDPALPQDSYELSWFTIDGGGATLSEGGPYSLGGSIGQADAGAMSGGAYSLSGGFWAGIPSNYNAFVPIALR